MSAPKIAYIGWNFQVNGRSYALWNCSLGDSQTLFYGPTSKTLSHQARIIALLLSCNTSWERWAKSPNLCSSRSLPALLIQVTVLFKLLFSSALHGIAEGPRRAEHHWNLQECSVPHGLHAQWSVLSEPAELWKPGLTEAAAWKQISREDLMQTIYLFIYLQYGKCCKLKALSACNSRWSLVDGQISEKSLGY